MCSFSFTATIYLIRIDRRFEVIQDEKEKVLVDKSSGGNKLSKLNISTPNSTADENSSIESELEDESPQNASCNTIKELSKVLTVILNLF